MAAKKLLTKDEAVKLKDWFDAIDGHAVKAVRLHTHLDAPGAFGMEKTLSIEKTKGLQMKFDGQILWWTKGELHGFIPAAAINGGILE
jgi:hypothetical protein